MILSQKMCEKSVINSESVRKWFLLQKMFETERWKSVINWIWIRKNGFEWKKVFGTDFWLQKCHKVILWFMCPADDKNDDLGFSGLFGDGHAFSACYLM